MALGCGIFLLTAVDSKKLRWIALAALSLMVLLLLLSQSKTALILLLLTLLMLPMHRVVRQQYKLQVFIYLIALVLIGSVAVFIVSNLEFIIVDTLGKDLEFNGRVPIWILILDKAFERPWLGYGFAGFWTSPESLYVLNNSWAGTQASIEEGVRFHAHNGFIDLFIQLGLLGLSLFIFNFIKVFLKVISVLNYTKAVEFFWMLQFLVLMLVFNLSEAITILSTGTLWTLYVSIALSTAVQQNRIRKTQYLGASALKS
jgi:O-antigen ligase